MRARSGTADERVRHRGQAPVQYPWLLDVVFRAALDSIGGEPWNLCERVLVDPGHADPNAL